MVGGVGGVGGVVFDYWEMVDPIILLDAKMESVTAHPPTQAKNTIVCLGGIIC
jgi:hypothetical protein